MNGLQTFKQRQTRTATTNTGFATNNWKRIREAQQSSEHFN